MYLIKNNFLFLSLSKRHFRSIYFCYQTFSIILSMSATTKKENWKSNLNCIKSCCNNDKKKKSIGVTFPVKYCEMQKQESLKWNWPKGVFSGQAAKNIFSYLNSVVFNLWYFPAHNTITYNTKLIFLLPKMSAHNPNEFWA